MSTDHAAASPEEQSRSRFTFRDLKQLSQSSVHSPLRVISLIDFDCFYAQCESVRLGLPPERPLGVQQFKHVIAINYAARAAGLKKVTAAEEAKRLCPSIVLQHVPTWREGHESWAYRDDALQHMDIDKSSLDYYRLQSRKAMEVLKRTLPTSVDKIERAGIDETYVDMSTAVYEIMLEQFPELQVSNPDPDQRLPLPSNQLLDWRDTHVEAGTSEHDPVLDWDDVALHIGASLVHNVRTAIRETLNYTCSAGIARNMVVAKLAAGHNKPNGQTAILSRGAVSFLSTYKITKLRGLGRKLGRHVVHATSHELIHDLQQLSHSLLVSTLGASTATWLHALLRGHDFTAVTSRTTLKSVLSAKTFTTPITSKDQAASWLHIFAADIVGRLDDLGAPRPKTIAVHLQINGPRAPTRSKQAAISPAVKIDIPTLKRLATELLAALEKDDTTWPLVTLSVSVSDLELQEKGNAGIEAAFSRAIAGPKSHATLPLLARIGGGLGTAAVPNTGTNAASVPAPASTRPKKRTLHDFLGSATPAQPGKRPQQPVNNDDNSQANGPARSGSAEALGDEGAYRCPTCGRDIAGDHVLEHLDWHAAVALSKLPG
jgi:DNA polymerase eta